MHNIDAINIVYIKSECNYNCHTKAVMPFNEPIVHYHWVWEGVLLSPHWLHYLATSSLCSARKL